MKTPMLIAIASGVLLSAPAASAALYKGTWTNTTFSSSGPLKLNLTLKNSRASGSLDFDGNVFGGPDPAAIPFDFPFNAKKATKFKVLNTSLGDVAGTYSPNGDVSLTLTHIPGGFPTEVRIDANIDLKLQTFTGTFEMDDSNGLYAQGKGSAHVHKAPAVSVPKQKIIKGNTGQVQAKVTSNTAIKKIQASSPDGAKVKVTGKNPYVIKVSNITKAVTRVKFTVTNADGKKTTKTIKFVRK